MGKNKSSAKSPKKASIDPPDKMDNGKTTSQTKDPKPGSTKSKQVSKPGAKSTKGGNNTKSKSSSSGISSLWLVLVLSIAVGMAAIIYTNEDVKMFFVKFTPLGSKPWETLLQSNQNSADVKSDNVFTATDSQKAKETGQTKDNIVRDAEQKTAEATTNEQSKTDQTNNKNDQSKSKTDQIKSSKGDGGRTDSSHKKVEDSGRKEEEEGEKKKKKSMREDYPHSKITSKEDFKIRKKLDAADVLLDKGDLAAAADKFDAILKDHPHSPRAMWGKARTLDKMAEKQRSNSLLEESMGLLDQAMRMEKTPDALAEQIGRKLADRQGFRGWMGKEAGTWRYLSERFPGNVEFENLQGVAYLKMGKIDRARTVFQQVLAKHPDSGFGQVHLGFILKTSDSNYAEAIPMLQAGIDSGEPGTSDARFYTHLGDAYHRMNHTDKATEIYKQGHKLGLFMSQYQRSTYNAETKIIGRPWWTPEQTTYSQHLKMLEKNWKVIREEGLAQLNKKSGSFRPEDENLSDTGDWKQFTLYHRGKKDEAQCKKAPKTCALIDQFQASRDCTRGQVKFSVMHPGVHVWPHTGPTNCRLRAHLGLVIPEGPKIRVAEEFRTWKEGKFIIFDDSFEHEVWHEGTELRLVLIVDFWHPEIPDWERRSLAPI